MAPRGSSKKTRVAKKRTVRNTRIKRIKAREKPPEESVIQGNRDHHPKSMHQSVEPADKIVAVGENFTCSTPKGREFRIPKLDTCPAAPMKRRPGRSDDVQSMKRAEGFFDPPDIELFFMFVGNSQA